MARRTLGDERLWWRILDANPVRYPFPSRVAPSVRASLVLANTAGVSALTLIARYEGARGNNIRITVRNVVATPARDELLVFEFDGAASIEVERYRYADADVQGLAEQVELRSTYLRAELTATAVALTPITRVALTGGRDGPSGMVPDLAPGAVLDLPGAGPATRASRARSF
jgi:hypothetical protein